MLLHGVLTEAFSFLKGPDNLYNLYQKKYTEEVQNFALQQMGRRRRGEYSDGVPRIVVPFLEDLRDPTLDVEEFYNTIGYVKYISVRNHWLCMKTCWFGLIVKTVCVTLSCCIH